MHKSIIRRYKFFNSAFGHNWSESESSTITLPEDAPAVIARLLCWLYSAAYPSEDINDVGIAQESPSHIEGPHCMPKESTSDEEWFQRARLHQLIAATADKYDLPELFQETFRRFLLAWCQEDEADIETPADSRRPENVYQVDIRDSDLRLLEGCYEIPGASKLFKNWALLDIHLHMGAGRASSHIVDKWIEKHPDIAVDLVTTKSFADDWACANCGSKYPVLLRRCACELLGGCDKLGCLQEISDGNTCDFCFCTGTLEPPEGWPDR